jgi:hypothetical protein
MDFNLHDYDSLEDYLERGPDPKPELSTKLIKSDLSFLDKYGEQEQLPLPEPIHKQDANGQLSLF